jgi:DNA-binding GntR family transcriptional regulator
LILLRELGLPITRVVHTIAQADPRAWRKLGIRSRPHLVIEATAYTANGTVAYFQEIYIPTNRRKLLFDSELKGLEQI